MIKKMIFLVVVSFPLCLAQMMGPRISVQSLEHDFGNIEEGSVVSHHFIISNTGGDVLNITNVRATCGCTVAQPDKDVLNPGESVKLKVDFNSAGRIGKQERLVFVRSNAENTPELKLTIKAFVVRPQKKEDEKVKSQSLIFPETQHNFGLVMEGKVYDYTFQFVNQGSKQVNIKDIKTTCGCTVAHISSKNLKPGQAGTLRVEFDSTDRLGRLSRDIVVVSDDPVEPNKTLKIYADVKKGLF